MRRIPRPDWDRMLRLCNEWNALYKMPKVYFEVDDPNTSTTGRVVCEQWLNLEAGIHQELVNQMTSTFFSACFGFWRWLERQNALHALGDPDVPPARRSSRGMNRGDPACAADAVPARPDQGGPPRPASDRRRGGRGPSGRPARARGGSARRGRGRAAPRPR